MQIVSANLNHLIYSKGHPTQVFTAPLPFAPEDDATLLAWDQETHTLSYSVPPATEDGEPTLIDRVITQAEIDAGIAHITAPAPPVVPSRVSKAQLKLALLSQGIDLATLIAGLPAEQQAVANILVNDAEYYTRSASIVDTLGTVAGLTSAQVDALFISASQIDPAAL